MGKVFISYSHQDEAWKKKLLPQLHALEQAGVAMQVWHDRKIDGGDKWYPEILEAMADSVAAILLISPDFLASKFCVQEEVPALLKRQEEKGMLLIPVLVRDCPWQAHRWLKALQMLPRDGQCVAINFPGDLADSVFAAVARQVLAHFEQRSSLPPVGAIPLGLFLMGSPVSLATKQEAAAGTKIVLHVPVQPWPELDAKHIDLTRLPETGSALFGRDEELKLLDAAWSKNSEPRTRVLAFTAHGGVGKSTLINHWLAEMKRDNFRGATRVFGWSFYNQGVREQGAPSAETFIAEALKFFGDEAIANSPASPWDKGERLAHLVGAQRALFVLDGMEPLQSAHKFQRGKLLDQALESLLRGLAKQSAGLCLVTTREPLTDLSNKSGVKECDLEQITPQAGRALLRTARVVGTDAELEVLATRFGPHALAISLLGVYLHEQPGHGIGPAKVLEQLPGEKPVDRVLAGFEQWLGDSPEREVLHLLGFFDRPANDGCLRALRAKPAISGLTDHLSELGNAEWNHVLTRLEKLRLIHARQSDSGQWFVDAHPLVREHFAARLRKRDDTMWRQGHRRLYEHLCATTKEGDQPTLEDLQPLYQAVAHGCLAGLQQEVYDKVYLGRVLKGNERYSTHKLGASGSDLGAVTCFFEAPWRLVSSAITEADQAMLLSDAAFHLGSLGRLTEAIEPLRIGLETRIKQKKWIHAAISASNLSRLQLELGEVGEAVDAAQKAVAYADRNGDGFQKVVNACTLGSALHRAGFRSEAEVSLYRAELMQAERQPEYPLLYGSAGFLYCDLLLTEVEHAAWQFLLSPKSEIRNLKLIESCRFVEQHATQTLKWVKRQNWLLDIALDHLTLGQAAFYQSVLEKSEIRTQNPEIEQAISGLRRSGNMDYLPRGLLTRAWLRSLTNPRTGPESAQSDLDEAWEIAERGPMKLYMADIHLYRARLFFREKEYPWNKNPDGTPRGPADDLAAAEKLINACGYHRRDQELADAKFAILGK